MQRMLVAGLLLLAASHAGAQSALRDQHGAIRVAKTLLITYDTSGGFRYVRDGDDEADHRLKDEQLFAVAGREDTPLYFTFKNPLRYSWSVSEKSQDDPTYVAAKTFFDQIGELVSVVGAGPSTAPPPKSKEATNALKIAGYIATGDTSAKALEASGPFEFYSSDLLEWAMFSGTELGTCFKTPQGTDFVQALSAVDSAFYRADVDREDKPRQARHFADTASLAADALSSPETIGDMRTGVLTSKRVSKQLAAFNNSAEKARAALPAALDAAAKVAPGGAVACGNVMRYSHGVLSRFTASTGDLLAKRKALVAALDTLIGNVEEVLAAVNAKGTALRLAEIDIPDGEMKEVTLVVKRRAMKKDELFILEDNGADTVRLRIRQRQMLLAETSAGAAWLASVAYPRFGTDTNAAGQTVIGHKGDEPQTAAAVLMLNLIADAGPLGAILPMAQLGVGTGKNYPILLFGAGFRLLKPDGAITGGLAFPWERYLKDAKEGDAISGTAELEKELGWRLRRRSSFYVSIQRSF